MAWSASTCGLRSGLTCGWSVQFFSFLVFQCLNKTNRNFHILLLRKSHFEVFTSPCDLVFQGTNVVLAILKANNPMFIPVKLTLNRIHLFNGGVMVIGI